MTENKFKFNIFFTGIDKIDKKTIKTANFIANNGLVNVETKLVLSDDGLGANQVAIHCINGKSLMMSELELLIDGILSEEIRLNYSHSINLYTDIYKNKNIDGDFEKVMIIAAAIYMQNAMPSKKIISNTTYDDKLEKLLSRIRNKENIDMFLISVDKTSCNIDRLSASMTPLINKKHDYYRAWFYGDDLDSIEYMAKLISSLSYKMNKIRSMDVYSYYIMDIDINKIPAKIMHVIHMDDNFISMSPTVKRKKINQLSGISSQYNIILSAKKDVMNSMIKEFPELNFVYRDKIEFYDLSNESVVNHIVNKSPVEMQEYMRINREILEKYITEKRMVIPFKNMSLVNYVSNYLYERNSQYSKTLTLPPIVAETFDIDTYMSKKIDSKEIKEKIKAIRDKMFFIEKLKHKNKKINIPTQERIIFLSNIGYEKVSIITDTIRTIVYDLNFIDENSTTKIKSNKEILKNKSLFLMNSSDEELSEQKLIDLYNTLNKYNSFAVVIIEENNLRQINISRLKKYFHVIYPINKEIISEKQVRDKIVADGFSITDGALSEISKNLSSIIISSFSFAEQLELKMIDIMMTGEDIEEITIDVVKNVIHDFSVTQKKTPKRKLEANKKSTQEKKIDNKLTTEIETKEEPSTAERIVENNKSTSKLTTEDLFGELISEEVTKPKISIQKENDKEVKIEEEVKPKRKYDKNGYPIKDENNDSNKTQTQKQMPKNFKRFNKKK